MLVLVIGILTLGSIAYLISKYEKRKENYNVHFWMHK